MLEAASSIDYPQKNNCAIVLGHLTERAAAEGPFRARNDGQRIQCYIAMCRQPFLVQMVTGALHFQDLALRYGDLRAR